MVCILAFALSELNFFKACPRGLRLFQVMNMKQTRYQQFDVRGGSWCYAINPQDYFNTELAVTKIKPL